MSKKRLKNILKRQFNLKLPSFFQEEKTILGILGSEEIKKLKSLGQELVVMRME